MIKYVAKHNLGLIMPRHWSVFVSAKPDYHLEVDYNKPLNQVKLSN